MINTMLRSSRLFHSLRPLHLLHAALYATVGLVMMLCVQSAHADVVRIGVAQAGSGDPTTFGGSALGIVRNQKLLEKAFEGTGTKVEWYFFKGAGPAVNEALSNDQLDLAYEGDLPQVLARSNRLQTRLVAALGVRSPVYLAVPKGSSIHSIKDLAGKRVAIFRGTNGQLVADNLLAANGLSERDLKVINLDTGSTQAALAAKEIDAAFGGIELYKLRDQGVIDLVNDPHIGTPLFTRQTALVVRDDFVQSHPEQVQKVVDALVDAAAWASKSENHDAVIDEWAKSGVPEASWQAEFKQPLSVRLSPLIDPFLISSYQAVAEQAHELRLIRRSISVDDWFDTRFLDSALKKKGLATFWTSQDAQGNPISQGNAGSSSGTADSVASAKGAANE